MSKKSLNSSSNMDGQIVLKNLIIIRIDGPTSILTETSQTTQCSAVAWEGEMGRDLSAWSQLFLNFWSWETFTDFKIENLTQLLSMLAISIDIYCVRN